MQLLVYKQFILNDANDAGVSVVMDGELIESMSEVIQLGGRDVKEYQENVSKDDPLEALFSPELLFQINPTHPRANQCGIAYLVVQTIQRCDPDRRPILYDSIVLTGLTTRTPGFRAKFEAHLKSLMYTSEYPADHQSKNIKIRGIPEYYPEIYERAGPVAAWFGGGITAKMVFPDPKSFYTRDEFAQHGKNIFHFKQI